MTDDKTSTTLSDAVAGQAAGWAIWAAAVMATGGTAGWKQSPAWSAALGMAVGSLGLLVGARWTDRSRIAPPPRLWFSAGAWAAGFLLVCWLLIQGFLGESFLSLLVAAGLVGLIGGAASGLLGDATEGQNRYGHAFAWCLAFVVGLVCCVLAGYVGGDLFEELVRRMTGSDTAGTVALVSATAAAGALGGSAAGLIAGMLRD
jgi:hypothetical protein